MSQIQYGELVAFRGTRLLAISFTNTTGPRILDTVDHGTLTASIIANASTDVIVVMVQPNGSVCAVQQRRACEFDESMAHAMEWIAQQDWIDIVSLSVGNVANEPDPGPAFPTEVAFQAATERAARSGKLIVAATGNSIAPVEASFVAGPPYVIAVGGADPTQRGDASISGKSPDVVSSFSYFGASAQTIDGRRWGTGTSVATPRVAGALAAVLAQIRPLTPIHNDPATARKTSAEIRGAMNATALVWSPTDWSPQRQPTNDTLTNAIAQSLPEFGPAQTGWGYVDESLVPAIVAAISDHGRGADTKSTLAAYMAERQAAREAYWT